jgi:hypothetical protein
VHLGQKKDRKDAVFPSSRTEEATEREREREKKGKREREREREKDVPRQLFLQYA